jgi:hypothetical protein
VSHARCLTAAFWSHPYDEFLDLKLRENIAQNNLRWYVCSQTPAALDESDQVSHEQRRQMSNHCCGRVLLDFLLARRGLQFGDKQQTHIDAIKALGSNNPARFLYEHLNEDLNILDSKAHSTFIFASILVVIYVWIIDRIIGLPSLLIHIVIYAGTVIAIVALVLLMFVQKLYWPPTNELSDENAWPIKFLLHRNRRTIYYRQAWRLIVISFFMLLCAILYFVLLASPDIT